MAISIDELKTSLATIINTLTSKKVIWADQNAPTPDGDYIIMKISTIRFIGSTDYYSKPDDNELSKTQGDREVVLSLICVSEQSLENLLELVNKLELPSSLDLFLENKIVYVAVESDPIDVTTTINNNFETRSSVELLCRISKNYSSSTEDNVPKVVSIGINGEIDSDQQQNSFAIDMVIE